MQTLVALLTTSTITQLILFPVLACLPLLLFPRAAEEGVKRYALLASLVELGLCGWFVWRHLGADGSFPLIREVGLDGQRIPWIESWGIYYDLGMDGISMPLVLLTCLLLPLVILGSWRGITRHWRGFAISLLLLTTGMIGALVAFDLFLFYVFWELMLVPMYLIIGIWGGDRKIYAAVKFFLFTMAGSLPMLLGILWLGWGFRGATGEWSFAYLDLLRLDMPVEHQMWLFLGFALAFAVKVPLVPLHTWLPDAHVEAPTGGSVILAGVLLKMGTYGFLRFAIPMFPQAARAAAPWLIGLALAGILYGALVAWVQEDMKKLVAYSSVAHLGFVMLGLFALDLVAWQGALLQMVNHGISTGALFLLVGMLYDRLHTRKFAEFGGLAKSMPWFAFFLVFTALSSVGLPFLNGFAGEFLILAGSFRSVALDLDLRWAVVFATFGVVLAAIYLLKMLSRTLWGPITREENRTVADLDLREKLALAPLCVLMLWIGLAPATFLAPSRAPLEQLLDYYQLRLDQTPVAQASLGPALPWATGGGVHRVATEEGGPDDHPQASAPVVGAGLGTFPPDLPSVVGAGLRARPGVEPAKTAGDTP